MTKYEKSVTINIGNYESMKIGVSEAGSFEECDVELRRHLTNMDLRIDKPIGKALGMQNKLED